MNLVLFVYSALVVGLAPLVFAVFVWRYGLRRTLKGLGERFALWHEPKDRHRPEAEKARWQESKDCNRPEVGTGFGPAPRALVWVHAASVGEVRAVEPFLRAVRRRFPDVDVALTTTTVTGRDLAGDLGLALEVRLAPLDLGFAAVRFLRRWRPQTLVIIETELWPNWIRAALERNIPVMIVNGRLSDKAVRTYLLLKFLWSPLLRRLFAVGAQSPLHAERFLALGADPSRTSVTGNLKCDVPLPDLSARLALFGKYGFGAADRVWVCGSLHPPEDEAVVRVFQALRGRDPSLRLVLAARHLEHVPALRRLLEKEKLSYSLRSAGVVDGAVFVLDTLGELSEIYGVARWAFVGGSLAPRGGQNPLEPARWGVPVLFGPHMENFRELAELFLRQGAAVRVNDGAHLAEEIGALLEDPRRAEALGAAARRVADSQRGAVEKSLALLEEALRARGGGQRMGDRERS